MTLARCLKITEKVSFNIASEASYVYILSGQKLIKNAKKLSILASFWKLEACGQTVLPDRSFLIGQKLVENAEIKKFKCDILSKFQIMCDVIKLLKLGELILWLKPNRNICIFDKKSCLTF